MSTDDRQPSIAPDGGAPLTMRNLLNDMGTLCPTLVEQVRRESWLDAFLLAAGIAQISDDYVQPEFHPFDAAADYLGGSPSLSSRLFARAASTTATLLRAGRRRHARSSGVLRWQRQLDELVEALADAAVAGVAGTTERDRVHQSSEALARSLGALPESLRREVVRLPACFHAFDQRPADVDRLSREFAARWPDRRRPLVVVGVRTSGSYLAPLCAAYLRAGGYQDVSVLATRPGRGLRRTQRGLLRRVGRRGGLALLMDDPPVTGASIAATAGDLVQAGMAAGAIVLLLQVFDDSGDLPARLRRYESVVLPPGEWEARARLEPSAVGEALSDLLGPRTSVGAVERVPALGGEAGRDHFKAIYRVELHQPDSDEPAERHIVVEGAGLGYFGRFALGAAHSLEQFSPRVYGLRDGLLYRDWLPDERRLISIDETDEEMVATTVASYTAQRQHAFGVADDISLRMVGQQTAREVAGSVLSQVFGRAAPVAQVLLTDRASKRLLRVDHASVVDGNTDLHQWFFADDARRSLIKVNLGDDRFSNLGLTSFDPAFDLAGATARAGTASFSRRLRQEYSDLTQQPVARERLLLHELAHLWRRGRTQPETEPALGRARSAALQRYLAEVYLGDLVAPAAGPLCAIDVDGVLETEHLGFAAASPASALALRALLAHGYRPVLATGRSLPEVVERCRTYGLTGGVAEYGAAIYDIRADSVRQLLAEPAADALSSLRADLGELDGVRLDPDYRLGVRAFRLEGGRRTGLPAATVSWALERAGSHSIRAIEGEGQTDFMVRGVDKGTGLRALAAQLGVPEGPQPPFDLAVGDTAEDIPLAALATRACAPGHARATLEGHGFSIMRRPYQSGFAQAVGGLLGHRPGGCEVCSSPEATRERRTLLALLAVQERGQAGMPLQALKAVLQVA